jgi:putative ubiquitin-RnfH superfamily antitoxin RatB of RatAB toxin-antitoxin module
MKTAETTATKRVNVNFAIPTYTRLQNIAARKGITVSEALRQAISLTDYLEGAIQDENAKIYIDRGNGLNELVIR